MTTLTSPHLVSARLEEIERDLAERALPYEEAAGQVARLKRDYELRLARARVVAQGRDAKDREANALIAVAAAEDGVYEGLQEAVATYEAQKAAIGVLEARSMIGMAILRSQGRS